jgi:hypothetical protein
MLSTPRDDAELAIVLGATPAGRQRMWIELPISGSLPLLAVIALDGVEAALVERPAPRALFATLAGCFPDPPQRPAGAGTSLAPLIEALPIGSPEVRRLATLGAELGGDPVVERAQALPGPYLAVLLPGLGGRLSALLAKGSPLRLAPVGLELPLELEQWRLPRVVRSGDAQPLARRDAFVYVAAAALPRWGDLAPGSLEGFSRAARPPRELLEEAGFEGAADLYGAPLPRWERARLIAR